MDRDRRAEEGVDEDQVVAAVGRVGEPQPCVAEHDRHVRRARADEVEQLGIARDGHDGGIDLVIGQRIARPPLTGERAGAEPDHGIIDRPAHARVQRIEHLRDAAAGEKFRDHFRPALTGLPSSSRMRCEPARWCRATARGSGRPRSP